LAQQKKHKVPTPILVIWVLGFLSVLVLAILPLVPGFPVEAHPSFGSWYIYGVWAFLTLGGAIFASAGRLNLGGSYAVMPKAKKLRTGGLYRFFRHPIYMGNQAFAIGICILLGSWIALLLCFVVLIPVNIFRAKYEERLLVEEFGDEYRQFQKRTLF
jgi:protein-S-isoprenylcysteine O-methyltransferase Ste14